MRHQTRAGSVCILPLRSAVVNWLPEQPASELLAALQVSPAEVRERPAIRQVVTELGQQHRRTTGVRELVTVAGVPASLSPRCRPRSISIDLLFLWLMFLALACSARDKNIHMSRICPVGGSTMHYYTDVLKKYATFKGWATRAEFWWFALIDTVISVALYFGGPALGLGMTPVLIYTLATALPNLAVTVRRLHDTGRSGWNVLWSIIPIESIAVVIMCAGESSADESHGPYPVTANPLPAI
ncbi:DUF805 domain-containing protein [Streptomyces xanthochromogenes]|uniref:DUF805 domain-containing protein n=1 Tax=Streptomyces xanthochromogenes TaxID=67384 RepID=UPI0037B76D87